MKNTQQQNKASSVNALLPQPSGLLHAIVVVTASAIAATSLRARHHNHSFAHGLCLNELNCETLALNWLYTNTIDGRFSLAVVANAPHTGLPVVAVYIHTFYNKKKTKQKLNKKNKTTLPVCVYNHNNK